MKLQEMSIKSLLGLHNSIAATPAGLKSFATKTKLISRIESIVTAKNIELVLPPCLTTTKEVSEKDMLAQGNAADKPNNRSNKRNIPIGKGIGKLARELLLDPAGYPHQIIANMVNERIVSAQATANSIRWYACKMRMECLPAYSGQRDR